MINKANGPKVIRIFYVDYKKNLNILGKAIVKNE